MQAARVGLTALLVSACSLQICSAAAAGASPSPLPDLFDYLTDLAENQTFYYEPVDPAYYLKINNNSIIEFNGTFYEDLNGTFYQLQREANGTFVLPSNDTAITESASADGTPAKIFAQQADQHPGLRHEVEVEFRHSSIYRLAHVTQWSSNHGFAVRIQRQVCLILHQQPVAQPAQNHQPFQPSGLLIAIHQQLWLHPSFLYDCGCCRS